MRSKNPLMAFAALLLFIAAAPAARPSEPSVPGGYQKAAVTNEEVIAAAAFAVNAQQEAIRKAKGEAVRLELVEILEAAEQVVAGANYRLHLKVKLNGTEAKAEAVIWWQAWRRPDPYQLTEWNWK